MLKEIAVTKKENFVKNENWGKVNHDITISKRVEEKTYNKDGTITIKFKEEKTNLTRQINETAKLLKANTAQDKLEQIKKLANNI